MTGLLAQAGLFVLESIAGFFTTLLLLRFYMQMFRVSFGNPIGGFVLQLTNWLVIPLRRLIPSAAGLDLASLLPALLLQAVLIMIAVLLRSGAMLPTPELALLLFTRSIVAILRISIYLLIGLLILQAVLSWVSPYSPLSRPIDQMTQPFLRPIRRFIPPFSGIDLSPLVAILLAQVILIFLQ